MNLDAGFGLLESVRLELGNKIAALGVHDKRPRIIGMAILENFMTEPVVSAWSTGASISFLP